MASVSKRYCARGDECTQYARLNEPATVRRSSKSSWCDRCLKEHAGGLPSPDARWKAVALEAIFPDEWERRSLWDLFALSPYHERGRALSRLDAKTLGKLRVWLDENKVLAVERCHYGRWVGLRAEAGVGAWLKQLPSGTQLRPSTEDGLPIQAVGVRTDGKKWDLNLPIRAELLRRYRRYFSERDMAKLLGMAKTSFRRLRGRMDRRGPNRATYPIPPPFPAHEGTSL